MRPRRYAVRMPAEWEPHDGTWLAYPKLSSDWPGKVTAVRWAVAELARKLARRERVHLLVDSRFEQRRALSVLRRAGVDLSRVQCHKCATDRSWLRDSGPTFVHMDGGLGAVCWGFNGWGRYPNWKSDRAVGEFVAHGAGATTVAPSYRGRTFVMEGGAIDSNGRGSVLSTKQCLLSQGPHARNPGVRLEDAERVLEACIGATNLLWLAGGIAGDDTGGHIDTVARFVGPNRVAAAVESDRHEENYPVLRENLSRLRSMRDERGQQLEIVELPMPRPVKFDRERLPATYANFYVANGAVLVPTFNDPNDRVAMRILEQCFPDREVCGIHSVDLVLGQGTLHCLAQPQPVRPSTAAAQVGVRRVDHNEGLEVANQLPTRSV